jgi:hypothetical protein
MRTPIAFVVTAACALAGCTIIPAAEPGRTRPAAPPMPGPAPMPAYTPAPNYAPPAPAAPPAYSPAPAYAPPPGQELPAEPGAPLAYAALGQTVSVGGPRVTPLAVLEDSRCAMNARCVWAGQVRLRLRIDSGTGGTVEVTSGKPVTVADGTLELVEVRPDKVAGGANHGAVKPAEYRFCFRFMGGY